VLIIVIVILVKSKTSVTGIFMQLSESPTDVPRSVVTVVLCLLQSQTL